MGGPVEHLVKRCNLRAAVDATRIAADLARG